MSEKWQQGKISYLHIGAVSLSRQSDESLLDTLERHGYRLEYQCRQGFCGACRCQLVKGTVHYPHPPLAFLGAQECLPCCGYCDDDVELVLPHCQAPH